MANVDTYSVVGVSVLNGALTYRFANRSASARTAILRYHGHEDIQLFDITVGKAIVAVSKDEAVKWLHAHHPKVCKHERYKEAVMPTQRAGAGGVKKLKESLTSATTPSAKVKAAEVLIAQYRAMAESYLKQANAATAEADILAGEHPKAADPTHGGRAPKKTATKAAKGKTKAAPAAPKVPPAEQLPAPNAEGSPSLHFGANIHGGNAG